MVRVSYIVSCDNSGDGSTSNIKSLWLVLVCVIYLKYQIVFYFSRPNLVVLGRINHINVSYRGQVLGVRQRLGVFRYSWTVRIVILWSHEKIRDTQGTDHMSENFGQTGRFRIIRSITNDLSTSPLHQGLV